MSLFLGTTRDTNTGKRVLRLSYEAYEPMATKQLREIALSAVRKWELKAVVVLHRLGDVPVGECSVAIACASPHRQGAMCASSEIIERIKETLTVWKREVYEDGTTEWRANREWVYSSPSSNICPTDIPGCKCKGGLCSNTRRPAGDDGYDMISSVRCYLQDYIEQLHQESPCSASLSFPSAYDRMRSSTLHWLFDWSSRLSVSSHSVQQAILLIDSFISQRQIATSEVYRIIAGIALVISTKVEETRWVTLEDVQREIKNCPLGVASLSKVELLMLETEQWKVIRPTAASVSRLLLQSVCPDFDFEAVYRCSDAFAALIYSDSALLSDPNPATLAVASVCAALEKLSQTDFQNAWLESISGLFNPQSVAFLLLKIRKRVQQLASEDETTSGSDTFEDN